MGSPMWVGRDEELSTAASYDRPAPELQVPGSFCTSDSEHHGLNVPSPQFAVLYETTWYHSV